MSSHPDPIQRLLQIMARLRDPEAGCPWDIQQSYATIVPHTIEEAYEVAEAIEKGDLDELRDELGDLLFQVVFYAQLAREEGRFDFNAVVEGICAKMIRRHPHVFGDEHYANEQEQRRSWERIKAAERSEKGGENSPIHSQLDGIPASLPALTRAGKIQRKAAHAGYDWADPAELLQRVSHQQQQLAEAVDAEAQTRIEEEMGELLFSCVNLSRHLGIDPETALRKINRKFIDRFLEMEAHTAERDEKAQESRADALDFIWKGAKMKGPD